MQLPTQVKLERVLKQKQVKKPGQYTTIITTVSRNENVRTVYKDSSKVVVFVGGLCPKCTKEFFGDLEAGIEGTINCPNEECAQGFKLNQSSLSLELID